MGVEPAYNEAGKSVLTLLNELSDKCLDTNDPIRPTTGLDALLIVVSATSLNGLNQRLTQLNQGFKLPLLHDVGERLTLSIDQANYNRFIKVAPLPLHYVRDARVEGLTRLQFAQSDLDAKDRASTNNSKSLSSKLTALSNKKAGYESGLQAVSNPQNLPIETASFNGLKLAELGSQLLQVGFDDKPHALGLLLMGETGSLNDLKEAIGA